MKTYFKKLFFMGLALLFAGFKNSFADHEQITIANKTPLVASLFVEQQSPTTGELSYANQFSIQQGHTETVTIDLEKGILSQAYVIIDSSKCEQAGYIQLDTSSGQPLRYEISESGSSGCEFKLKRITK